MNEEKPNVLVLFAEQHRGDCLSSDGHPMLLTPNIDAIGGNGTRFSNAYSTCPVRVPARRSLISGQFPDTHGARANINEAWNVEHTIGSVLRDAGYQTGWIGRSMHQYPVRKRFGFEEMVFNDHRCEDDDFDEFLGLHMPVGGNGYWGTGVMHNDWTARPFHLPEELHHTNWTMHEAQRFLDRRDPTRPYCMFVSFLASHPPLVPPEFYLNRYLRTGVPDPYIGDWAEPPENGGVGLPVSSRKVDLKGEALLSARAGYYGLINHLDDQIRRLLNGIRGGIDPKNTIVVYTSDHGEMLGDHHMWAKSVPYQGSVRVPMLIQLPPRFDWPRSQVVDSPVCLEDIMPTLLDLIGVDTPETVEGTSLVDLLQGGASTKKRYLHLQCAPQHHTLTDGKEKYIWFTADGSEHFFRLEDDPFEMHELSQRPEEADRVAYWRGKLILELADSPEGFSDGRQLIAGRPFPGSLPGKSM